MTGISRRATAIRFGVVLLLLAVCASDAMGQLARLEKTDWKAHWIWRPGEAYGNAWIAYRKTFDLDTDPSQAITHIAVDSKYWLWVNGEMVVRDGGLKRGPTPNDTYFDVVDIAPHLKTGSNTIAVLVWYWGRSSFSHIDSGKGGLLFEANIDGTLLTSDRSWLTKRHPAFGWTAAPVPNFRLSEYNVLFDARNDMTGWMNPGFDAGTWEAAIVEAAPVSHPWNRLFERTIPQFRDSGLLPYGDAPQFPFDATGDTVIVSLPYAAQVTPYFRIDAPEGLRVDMRTDQYYTLSIDRVTKIYSVRSEYVTKAGVQEFETPAWMSGEAIRYHFPAGIKVLDLQYRETGYDADFEGWFRSSDDFFDRLWVKARRTVAITMRGYLMETADRERKQGTGDATVALLSALYSHDNRVDAMARKYWAELEAWRAPDGVFLSGVPGNWGFELSQPNLYSFGDLGLWAYYLTSGDRETVELLYPAVRDYLLLWEMEPSGLVIHRDTDWNWYDWGTEIDEPLIENAWYYLALRAAEKMARLTGNLGDIPVWTNRMQHLKEAYNTILWDENRYHTEGQFGQPDDRGNALAVLAGFPSAERRPDLVRLLKSQMHASPYMENFVDAALFHLGEADAALKRMKTRFCEMVESDYTTLWEFFDPAVASKTHQFGSGTLRTLSYYVAGIQPVEPGFKIMRIRPMMGSLEWIDAAVPTPQGLAEVKVETNRRPKLEEESLRMRVVVPEGAIALVGVPMMPGALSHITVGDDVVWEADHGQHNIPGIVPIEKTDAYVEFQVQPGTWEFVEYLKPSPAEFEAVKVISGGGGSARVQWVASQEVPGTSYHVEEKLNDSFEGIATLAGQGASVEARTYEHSIAEVTPGLHTYRVMATTDDGCFVLSDVVTYEVPSDVDLAASHVYPNPMSNAGQVLVGVDEAQSVRVEIYNAMGQRVSVVASQFMIPDEQYRFDIDSSRLPSGTYALVLRGDRSQAARRFVVIH